MLGTVLLPTDLSASQELVMRFCAGLGELGMTRVICCHVVDATGLEGPVIETKVEGAERHMAHAVAPLSEAGLEVDLRVRTGDPEQELLALAAEEKVDAIVCGSSGKSAADRLFVGSVSERLARDSGVPNLTVRYDLLRTVSDPADMCRRFGKLLLVPTDFSGTAARAFDTALAIAKSASGMVRIVNVEPAPPENGSADQDADSQLHLLVEIAKGRGVNATPVIGHGVPERAILAEAEASRVSGIVVGSRGRSVLQEALLGSVSMTLMRQAPCPVLIVP